MGVILLSIFIAGLLAHIAAIIVKNEIADAIKELLDFLFYGGCVIVSLIIFYYICVVLINL